MTAHAEKAIQDILSNTHFWVKGLEHPTKTNRGTRPGDPVADLLFNMCVTVILNDATEKASQRLGDCWAGQPDSCQDFSASQPVQCPGYIDLSYVDDCVFLLYAHNNDQIQTMACVVVEEICRAAAKRGLLVNFEQGKTEMIWTIRGKGSRQVREQLLRDQNRITWHGDELSRELRVVHAYKHLGTWVQTGGKHGKEIQSRVSAAAASWGPLTRSFYSKKRISAQAKAKVFGTLTYSRLLYNAHTWTGVTDAQLDKWENGVRKPLAALVKSKLGGLAPFRFSVEHLAGLADLLTPSDSLRVARLRFMRRLFEDCPNM